MLHLRGNLVNPERISRTLQALQVFFAALSYECSGCNLICVPCIMPITDFPTCSHARLLEPCPVL